jgi:glycosyltransferase involved in cell wall biosynthesis
MNVTDRSKTRLLIFIPTLQCGGSEKYVSLLCDNIDTERFSVCLVVLNNAGQFYTIRNKLVEVVDLGEKRVLFSLPKIRSIVKKYQPDIIFTTANHLNLYFAIFRNLFPKKIKFAARESSIVSINSRRAKFPVIYNRLTRQFYDRFDIIICQSAYMQQDLISNYNIPADKTAVIHNAAESAVQNAVESAGTAANKEHKFITVARLSEEKGIERLIHAVGLVSVPFRFYIVGDGDKRPFLEKLVMELQLQEKIFFEGQKPEPFAGMQDADLFLMGSYYEGFPNVLTEAGMLGIPVIAFNVPGGINEIIVERENGMLADDNDIIGFATTVREALILNFDRNKIIAGTRKRFSVEAMISKTEQLFIKLLSD